ncbi:MAG: hypothetical protein WAK17_02310 [Candidatus Nitrosopolaris sp.]|jgi:hypothetical protein
MGPNLRNSPVETFNITNYGSLTANFTPAPVISSDFLIGVILGPTVGAILGGFLGWAVPYLMNKRPTNAWLRSKGNPDRIQRGN